MVYIHNYGVVKQKITLAGLLLIAGLFAFLATFGVFTNANATSTTTVIRSANMATSFPDVISNPTKWFFFNDETNQIDQTLGTFVNGPMTAPLGNGSAEISVSGSQRRNLATYQFAGTKISDITEMRYSTFNPSLGNGGSANRSGYLNFNVTFDGIDNWQRRLVFLPSDNGVIVQNQWQEWDAINSGNALYRYSGSTWPNTSIPGTTPRLLSDLISSYPQLAIRTSDSWLGIRVGEPYADGYTENIDKFVFATESNRMVFDFEPNLPALVSKEQCKSGSWQMYGFKNQGLCIQYINTGKDSRVN